MSLQNAFQSLKSDISDFSQKMRIKAAPLAFAAAAAALPLTADAAVHRIEDNFTPRDIAELKAGFAEDKKIVAILYVGELSSLGQYALDGTVGLIEREHPDANIAVIYGNPRKGRVDLHIAGQQVKPHTEHTVGRALLHEDIEEGLGLKPVSNQTASISISAPVYSAR